MDIRTLSFEELEDRIISGDEDAIREIARRYREGEGVDRDPEMAETYERMLEVIVDPSTDESLVAEDDPDHIEPSADPDQYSEDDLPWAEQYGEMSTQINSVLREKARGGNTAALMVLAEKYLASSNRSEREEGIGMLEEAERQLHTKLLSNNSASVKDALAVVFNRKGEYLEREYRSSYDPSLPEKIFEAYSNANEMDPMDVAGLARCYREGLGVEQDLYRANDYEERAASAGGIEKRYDVALDADDRGETIRTIEWLQNALLAEDAKEHPALVCKIRFLLATLNEKDENGLPVNEQEELDKLNRLASANDAAAAWYLADLTDDLNQKREYYELGANGSPEEYASVCRQSLDDVLKAIDELRREEDLRAENERLEQERLAEKHRQEAEALVKEEEERKIRKANAARRKKRILSAAIAGIVVLALVFGIIRVVDIVKARQEAAELASMNINLERSVEIKYDAYSYDSSGNKVLNLNDETIRVELLTNNPKPELISEEDWDTLNDNYKITTSVPDGKMENGVKVTITTEPADENVMEAFHKKYGCTVTEEKKAHQIEVNRFTQNITNGKDFKRKKDAVLSEMKRVCLEKTKQDAYYPTDVSIVNTFFLLPIPQKDSFSNAAIVIVTRANEGIFDIRDYVYIFYGPFGLNYTKETVNASLADEIEKLTGNYDLQTEVINEITGTENVLGWKYEWQEMD